MTPDAGAGDAALAPPGGVRRVVLIGPESTGKTELAEWLAGALGVPWSAEFAREYAEGKGGGDALTAADVDPIARGQLALEDAAIRMAQTASAPLVLHDTDLLSTEVYATEYYGAAALPAWLRGATVIRRASLYLLCDVDIPWRGDAARDAGADRAAMHRAFAAALRRHGVPNVAISGSREERRRRAMAAVGRTGTGAG